MSNLYKYLSVALILSASNCKSDYTQNLITFFVKPFEKKLKPIDKLFWGLGKKIIKPKSSYFHKHLLATYYGYLTITNEHNQIILPRRTTKLKFNILVTNKIEPIFMFPNTIDHWKIPYDTDAKLYEVTRTSEDKENYIWNINPIKMPTDRKISIQTIVLFAKPKNLVVPIGKFKTVKSRQILLPDIYMKQDFHDADIAIFMTNISKFFKPIKESTNPKNTLSGYLQI